MFVTSVRLGQLMEASYSSAASGLDTVHCVALKQDKEQREESRSMIII